MDISLEGVGSRKNVGKKKKKMPRDRLFELQNSQSRQSDEWTIYSSETKSTLSPQIQLDQDLTLLVLATVTGNFTLFVTYHSGPI